MSARALALLILLTAPLIGIALTESMSDADDPSFEEGMFNYWVNSTDTVELTGLNMDAAPDPAHLVVPETVMHDDKVYTVVRVSCYFAYDVIKTVHFPKSVNTIDEGIFLGRNLESVTVDEKSDSYKSIDGALFDKDVRKILCYPKKAVGSSYTLPDTVNTICAYAFSESNLESIILPNGLIEIKEYAFNECMNLQYINNVGEGNKLPNSLSLIDPGAFYGCEKLENIILPNELRFVGDYAFSNTGLTSINIPYGLYMMGSMVFSNCKNLREITSDNIEYPAEEGVLFEYKDDYNIVAYPAASERTTYAISSKVTEIMPYAFSGCSNLKEIKLPYNMMVLSRAAFADCHSLEKINLDDVVIIDFMVFSGCNSLKDVTLGDQLASIELYAFYNTAIEEIVIPDTVISLGICAFLECSNLKKVTIEEDCAAVMEEGVFRGCFNLKEIYLDSEKVEMETGSLNIGSDLGHADVTITIPKGYEIPVDAVSEPQFTTLTILIKGEHPFPMENLIGIAFCVLVLLIIVRMFRGV